jgi:hypothetical protein
MQGNEEQITHWVDRNGVVKDAEFMIEQINRVDAAYQKISAIQVSFGEVKGSKELSRVTKEAADAQETLEASTKSLIVTQRQQAEAEAKQTRLKQQTVAANKEAASSLNEVDKALQKHIGSIEANSKQQAQYKQRLQDIARELRENKKAYEDGKLSVDEYTDKMAVLTKEQVGLQEASKQLNVTLRNQVKELQAAEGSIDELQAHLNTLQNTYEKLSEAERGSDFGKQLKASIDELEPKVEALEQGIGRFGRTVGKYAGSFAGAFDILKTELADIQKKLQDPALEGKGLEELQNKEKLLLQLTQSLNRGFTSTREELKALQEAAKVLGINLGATNETFIQFASEVGEAKDSLGDLQAIINNKSSDTQFLDGAIEAVNGLAGAYGVAEGASELFGEGSEDLQRKMVKLQAILTIINGLQAIQNALQEDSAAYQTVLSAKTSLLNAAKTVEAALFASTTAAIQAETAAQVENVAASEAAAVAQEANIALTESTTAVVEGQTAATEAATGATKSLRTTFIASGIGVLIAGAAVAVGLLVTKINEWVSSSSKALEEQNKLADAIKSTNDVLIEQASLFNSVDQTYKRYLQNQIDLSATSGAGAEKQFALRKALYGEEKRLAQDQINYLGATNKQQATLLSQIEGLQNRKVFIYEQLQKAIKDGDESQQEASKKVIEGYDAQISKVQGLYQAGEAARQSLFAANQSLGLLTVEQAKFSAEEQRKLTLETTQIETDAVIAKNSLILSDEKSTLAQRLAATKANAEAQKNVIRGQRNDVLNNPSSTEADRTIAIKRAAQAERAITQQTSADLENLRDSYRQRDLQANKEAADLKRKVEVDLNKDIASSEVFSLEQRLDAQKKALKAEKELLDADYKLKLQQSGISDKEIAALNENKDYRVKSKKITDAELLALQKEYETQILQLSINSNTTVTGILKTELDKQAELREDNINEIQRLYDHLANSSTNQYAKEVVALNESFQHGKVSHAKYLQDREKLDREYQVKAANDTVRFIQDTLKLFVDAEQKQLDAKQAVENIKQQLTKATTDEEKKAIGERLDLAQIELDRATEVVDTKIDLENKLADATIAASDKATEKTKANAEAWLEVWEQSVMSAIDVFAGFNSGSMERESQRIQEEMKLLDERTEKEIDVVNQSVVSQDEKEKQIALIEARAAARRSQLEQQERANKTKQAKFDRDMQALKIFGETAFQVARYGFITPPAIAAGILGAASIALLYAKPLPKFYKGKDKNNDYEGFAWVDDGPDGRGGKPEAILRADGSVEIGGNKPRVTWIGKDDIVMPDASMALSNAAIQNVINSSDGKVVQVSDGPYFKSLEKVLERGFKGVRDAVMNQPVHVPKGPSILAQVVHGNGGSQTFL